MTDQMIQDACNKARIKSVVHNICWLISNGNELMTVVTYEFLERMKAEGYWVAAIYEHGYQVEA